MPTAFAGIKTCVTCRDPKPATTEHFHRDSRRTDGLNPNCKACVKEYQEANRERLALTNKMWRQSHPDYIAAAARRYALAHTDRVNASNLASYHKHHEKNIERKRAYNAANRERKRAWQREYDKRKRIASLEAH